MSILREKSGLMGSKSVSMIMAESKTKNKLIAIEENYP